MLLVENDGVPEAVHAGADTGSGTGNGLKGLRERLAPLGGTLESGPGADGMFRLRAEVPLEGDM